jgi:Nucleotide modification associated domain 2
VKGYIYITGVGTDPGLLSNLDDPALFGKTPTLGACMPNIRRFVDPGDYVFVVSGKTPGVDQYVVGGMRVSEKIDAKEAFKRFPENRLRCGDDGKVKGNVIVNADGSQHALDGHKPNEFKGRTVDFLVGKEAIVLRTPKEVELGRKQTVKVLSELLGKKGDRPIDIIGRMKKLDETQVSELVAWLKHVKAAARV